MKLETLPSVEDQLRRLHDAGFTMETIERYPRHLAAIRDNCIVLLEATPSGLRMTGVPGWRMGELMGVVVERGGRQVFQAKTEIVQATPDKLEALQRFRAALEEILMPTA